VAALVALLGSLAPTAALLIRAMQMSPLAQGFNIGMLALCAMLLLMVRSFVAARRSGRAAGPHLPARRRAGLRLGTPGECSRIRPGSDYGLIES
jgi:hypothetical protein